MLGNFASHAEETTLQIEVTFLLDFVKSTTCQFERNGSFHNGEEAIEHINKKYNYYSDEIKTTEDFIRMAAAKSTFSGKAYLIHCPSKTPITSQEWLLTELEKFRKRQ
ncbi:hypothetical protein EPA86_04765 [Litorilituus lipolyticus]|uniref:Uncharacterized protein n=2 Tax=Litorilituus lipolyticus TaxID=2491017 RepID=A0A502L0D3_9GAMM|nr:hypothetical protein EPA86_04765 [Litorilituus lipolyticus]